MIREALTKVSAWSIRLHAHPAMQPATLVVCAAWFGGGLSVDALTSALSIWAIVLGMMVLTDAKQKEEADERRDHALHAKLDELIKVTAGARDELVHIEDRPVEEIEAKRC